MANLITRPNVTRVATMQKRRTSVLIELIELAFQKIVTAQTRDSGFEQQRHKREAARVTMFDEC